MDSKPKSNYGSHPMHLVTCGVKIPRETLARLTGSLLWAVTQDRQPHNYELSNWWQVPPYARPMKGTTWWHAALPTGDMPAISDMHHLAARWVTSSPASAGESEPGVGLQALKLTAKDVNELLSLITVMNGCSSLDLLASMKECLEVARSCGALLTIANEVLMSC